MNKNIDIKKVIENHRHWLKEDVYGWEELKADLIEGVKAYAKREIMGDGDSAWVEPRGNIVYDNGESGED